MVMPQQRPFILVTNDDGIYVPGITALVEVTSHFGMLLLNIGKYQ
jgi:broad specificity polyphosphatase/5'/3'-nucleotidase SurE